MTMVLELGEELIRGVDLKVGEDVPIGVEEGGYDVAAGEVDVVEQVVVAVVDHERLTVVVGRREEPDIIDDVQQLIRRRRLASRAWEHLKHRSIIVQLYILLAYGVDISEAVVAAHEQISSSWITIKKEGGRERERREEEEKKRVRAMDDGLVWW
jgi:uncharacterized alkaline shock family protein YloU